MNIACAEWWCETCSYLVSISVNKYFMVANSVIRLLLPEFIQSYWFVSVGLEVKWSVSFDPFLSSVVLLLLLLFSRCYHFAILEFPSLLVSLPSPLIIPLHFTFISYMLLLLVGALNTLCNCPCPHNAPRNVTKSWLIYVTISRLSLLVWK